MPIKAPELFIPPRVVPTPRGNAAPDLNTPGLDTPNLVTPDLVTPNPVAPDPVTPDSEGQRGGSGLSGLTKDSENSRPIRTKVGDSYLSESLPDPDGFELLTSNSEDDEMIPEPRRPSKAEPGSTRTQQGNKAPKIFPPPRVTPTPRGNTAPDLDTPDPDTPGLVTPDSGGWHGGGGHNSDEQLAAEALQDLSAGLVDFSSNLNRQENAAPDLDTPESHERRDGSGDDPDVSLETGSMGEFTAAPSHIVSYQNLQQNLAQQHHIPPHINQLDENSKKLLSLIRSNVGQPSRTAESNPPVNQSPLRQEDTKLEHDIAPASVGKKEEKAGSSTPSHDSQPLQPTDSHQLIDEPDSTKGSKDPSRDAKVSALPSPPSDNSQPPPKTHSQLEILEKLLSQAPLIRTFLEIVEELFDKAPLLRTRIFAPSDNHQPSPATHSFPEIIEELVNQTPLMKTFLETIEDLLDKAPLLRTRIEARRTQSRLKMIGEEIDGDTSPVAETGTIQSHSEMLREESDENTSPVAETGTRSAQSLSPVQLPSDDQIRDINLELLAQAPESVDRVGEERMAKSDPGQNGEESDEDTTSVAEIGARIRAQSLPPEQIPLLDQACLAGESQNAAVASEDAAPIDEPDSHLVAKRRHLKLQLRKRRLRKRQRPKRPGFEDKLKDKRKKALKKFILTPLDAINAVVVNDSLPVHRELLRHFSPVLRKLLPKQPILEHRRVKSCSYSSELLYAEELVEEMEEAKEENGVEERVTTITPGGFPEIVLPPEVGDWGKKTFDAFIEWLYNLGGGIFPAPCSSIDAKTLMDLWILAGRLGVPSCQNDCVIAIEMERRQNEDNFGDPTETIARVYENTKDYPEGKCGLWNLLIDQ